MQQNGAADPLDECLHKPMCSGPVMHIRARFYEEVVAREAAEKEASSQEARAEMFSSDLVLLRIECEKLRGELATLTNAATNIAVSEHRAQCHAENLTEIKDDFKEMGWKLKSKLEETMAERDALKSDIEAYRGALVKAKGFIFPTTFIDEVLSRSSTGTEVKS